MLRTILNKTVRFNGKSAVSLGMKGGFTHGVDVRTVFTFTAAGAHAHGDFATNPGFAAGLGGGLGNRTKIFYRIGGFGGI